MERRDYIALRQETMRDLQRIYPGALMLTLKQAAKIYGYKDLETAKSSIGADRVTGMRSIKYYVGDIASDIARRRCGN